MIPVYILFDFNLFPYKFLLAPLDLPLSCLISLG